MTKGQRDMRPRPVPRSVWVLVLLLGVVGAGAGVWGLSHEQDDLTARAQLALAQAGYDDVVVVFDGRDAKVSGDVATDADATAVEDLVYRLRGVRRVDVAGVRFAATAEAPAGGDGTTDTTAAPPAPANVVVDVDGGVAALQGLVPTQAAAEAAVAAAQVVFGAENVMSVISVDADATQPEWLDSLSGIVAGLEGLDTGTAQIADGGVVLTGVLPDVESAEAIAEAVTMATSLPVDNRLDVLGPPEFGASAEGDAITLSGTLPGQTDVAAVIAAAQAQYGSVDNQLTAGTVRRSDWVDQLPELFPATAGWESWTVELTDEDAVFEGFAPSADALASLRDDYLAGLGIPTLELDAEVLPEVVAADITALLEGSATFEIGSTRLSPDATGLLDEVIQVLQANPATSVTVEGHTDDRGSAAGNLQLSQDRAQAVVDYLVAGGVDASRLSAVGYGEDRPIADNGTADGREQNRRIEFVVNTEGDG